MAVRLPRASYCVALAVAARDRMVGGVVVERVGGERNRRGERLERAHRGAVGIAVQRVPVTRYRGTIRPGADDGAQIVRGVVLIDGHRAAGDGDAQRPSGGIVAVEREVAQPVRDLAQPVRVIVLVGDGVPSGQRHAGQLAGGVVGISDLVAERIGVVHQAVEAVALNTREIERHLHVARREPGDAVAGVVAGCEHPAAGIGARHSARGAVVLIAPRAVEGVYERGDQAIGVILIAGLVAARIGDAGDLAGGGADGGDHPAGGVGHARQVSGRVVLQRPDVAVGVGNVGRAGGGIVGGPAIARAVGDSRQVAIGIVSEAGGGAVAVDRADAPAGGVVSVRDGVAGWVRGGKQQSGRVGNVEGGIAIPVRNLDLGGVVGNAVAAHGAVGRGDGGHGGVRGIARVSDGNLAAGVADGNQVSGAVILIRDSLSIGVGLLREAPVGGIGVSDGPARGIGDRGDMAASVVGEVERPPAIISACQPAGGIVIQRNSRSAGILDGQQPPIAAENPRGGGGRAAQGVGAVARLRQRVGGGGDREKRAGRRQRAPRARTGRCAPKRAAAPGCRRYRW